MIKKYKTPNDEVEEWKDKVYERIKNLKGDELTEYFERRADEILKKHGLKVVGDKFIRA